MISNSINTALNGLAAFESKFHESANNISNFPAIDTNTVIGKNDEQSDKSISESSEMDPQYFSQTPGSDLTSDVVNMMIAKRGYEANLSVLKTADDMAQSVINIFG